MPFQRLPESVQTLCAELLDQAVHAEAEAALLGAPPGSFVSKAIKGGTYWYLQRMEGDRKRQIYLGKESPSLLTWMEEVRQARARSAADEAQRTRLVSMLAAGGAAAEGPAVAKVLQLLAESGVFRMGGILVGTQAFVAYGNMLGVRFDRQALRTQDVDLAQDRAIGIALSEETASALDPRLPSAYRIRGREIRVDFLPADPLSLLGYLIERPAQAVLVAGSGALVNVPDPTRFALHKLSEQTKATDGLRQAGDLLEVLLEDRPGDLLLAWDALGRHPSPQQVVVTAMRKLPAELREGLWARIGVRGEP